MCIYALTDEEIDTLPKRQKICRGLLSGLPISEENSAKAIESAIECCDYTLGILFT